jgi:hypothetical protein
MHFIIVAKLSSGAWFPRPKISSMGKGIRAFEKSEV